MDSGPSATHIAGIAAFPFGAVHGAADASPTATVARDAGAAHVAGGGARTLAFARGAVEARRTVPAASAAVIRVATQELAPAPRAAGGIGAGLF